ncbi:MAG: stage V sporulation T C-terminal domain-containing protein [Lachnospiraceae bacterium]|nr:stage V sporulation T C-terminal domain-containing protein [Lachnospiraceae bacterium]
MKATGIVRRIDDLGRVVVPKEIRRTLRIREGDPLEIFTDRDGEIILKKYSPIEELGEFAQQFCEAASQILNTTVCVSDHDTFIASAGKEKKMFMGKMIHHKLEQFIDDRKTASTKTDPSNFPELLDSVHFQKEKQIAATIICQGDAVGSVIIPYCDDDNAMTLARTGAALLSIQMES